MPAPPMPTKWSLRPAQLTARPTGSPVTPATQLLPLHPCRQQYLLRDPPSGIGLRERGRGASHRLEPGRVAEQRGDHLRKPQRLELGVVEDDGGTGLLHPGRVRLLV